MRVGTVLARAAAMVGVLMLVVAAGGGAMAEVIEGHPGFTSTTATKHVTVIDRTDLPDLPATTCGAPAVAPSLVSETSTSTEATASVFRRGFR